MYIYIYKMNKIKNYLIGIARAWPIIIIFAPFLSYFLTNNNDLLLLPIVIILSDCFNHFLKYKICKPLLGSKEYPIIGSGSRPKGANNCGLFTTKTGKIHPGSYGMPSGHSQSALFFSSYVINQLLDSNMNDAMKMYGIFFFICLGLGIMYSRVYLKCHTVQQVIAGGLVGSILGTLYYNNKDFIKQQLNI